MPYIPHTKADVAKMLESIQAASIDELFDEIPLALRCGELTKIPEGMNELQLKQLLKQKLDRMDLGKCYIGAGAYEHHIPACVWDIASRGEFLTSYTPYQAEASQGTLQLLYEFQTMMAKLTGMEVSNASLYDGASALAEAILMAVRSNKHSKSKRILILNELHPLYKETIHTIIDAQGISLEYAPINALENFSEQDIAAIVISQPSFFGTLVEEVDNIANWAHKQNVMLIANVNPVSLALLKPPGEWGEYGADIVCGEGQPLGAPLASGGPYFGFLTTKMAFVRQLPGRLVGRTTDSKGNEGFTLTLQAREQHIRRSKARSNICTNQGLLVTAATIHMSALGEEGLQSVAASCHRNATKLLEKVLLIDGVKRLSNQPFFHEFAIELPVNVEYILQFMHQRGIEAGLNLNMFYPELQDCLLVCVTETKTDEDLDIYGTTLKAAIEEAIRLTDTKAIQYVNDYTNQLQTEIGEVE